MKEEMQKTGKGCHAETRTESRCTHGVQTCMGIIENNLVEVPIVEGDLLTHIISPSNMNLAYKRVVSNAGSGGIDGMEVKELLPYLRSHKDELVKKLWTASTVLILSDGSRYPRITARSVRSAFLP